MRRNEANGQAAKRAEKATHTSDSQRQFLFLPEGAAAAAAAAPRSTKKSLLPHTQ
jgi:hypothetical protein